MAHCNILHVLQYEYWHGKALLAPSRALFWAPGGGGEHPSQSHTHSFHPIPTFLKSIISMGKYIRDLKIAPECINIQCGQVPAFFGFLSIIADQAL